MPPVIDTQHRTSDLDKELESARREFAALERENRLSTQAQEAEYQRWIEGKAARFRTPLGLFVRVFSLIQDLDDTWRRQVFRGQEAFNPQTERAVRNLYAIWLGYSQMFQEKAEYLARQGINFDDALSELGRHQREADRLLRTWESPVLAQGPSFRSTVVSPEGTARFRELFPGAG
jgi:hypothetical protein